MSRKTTEFEAKGMCIYKYVIDVYVDHIMIHCNAKL